MTFSINFQNFLEGKYLKTKTCQIVTTEYAVLNIQRKVKLNNILPMLVVGATLLNKYI